MIKKCGLYKQRRISEDTLVIGSEKQKTHRNQSLKLTNYSSFADSEGKEGFRGVVRIDLNLLVTCDYDYLVKVWEDSALIQTLSGHSDVVRNVAYLPSQELLVSTSNDNTARVYKKKEKGRFMLETVLSHSCRLWGIQLQESKERLLVGGNQ